MMINTNVTHVKHMILLSAVYSIAHGLILTNNGLFWDDWWLFNNDSQLILNICNAAGLSVAGYLHVFLLSFQEAIVLHRILVFLSFLGSSLLLYSLLTRVKVIDDISRLFIVLFFATFPVDSARIGIGNSSPPFFNLVFFAGCWLLIKHFETRNYFFRLASICLFLTSFCYNSFIVFYAIIPIFLFYLIRQNKIYYKSFSSLICRHCDILILPILFWVFKTIYLKPYGLLSNYNQVNSSGIIHAVTWLPVAFYTSFLEVVLASFDKFSLSLILVSMLLTVFIPADFESSSCQYKKTLLFFGVFAFVVAVFPYLAVYRLPQSFNDWDSRHQILVPLGGSFMIYYILRILFDKIAVQVKFQTLLFALIVILFANTSINNYIEYQKDWFKQQSLILNFKDSDIVRQNTTFLIDDKTIDLNFNRRLYRFYEFPSMMKYSFGDERRFAENINEFITSDRYKDNIKMGGYSLRSYEPVKPQYKIVINYGVYKLTPGKILRLKLREWFTYQEFTVNVKQVVKLNFEKI